jgi:hypothetical protein
LSRTKGSDVRGHPALSMEQPERVALKRAGQTRGHLLKFTQVRPWILSVHFQGHNSPLSNWATS